MRSVLGAVVGAVALVAACGSGGDGPATVAAGSSGGATSSPPAVAPTGSTVVAPMDPGAPAPSPVAGLDADELLAAVTAPASAAVGRATGPTADRVVLPGGRTVWRVRVPGSFPARAARVTVAVAGRDLGPAVSPPDLSALVTVVPTADGLVDGAEVSYRWDGAEPVVAGPLEVIG